MQAFIVDFADAAYQLLEAFDPWRVFFRRDAAIWQCGAPYDARCAPSGASQ